jgi:hypothetical protein
MLSVLLAGALTLVLGFVVGWLGAWIASLRVPGAAMSSLWGRVLLVAGVLAVILFALVASPLGRLPASADRSVSMAPTRVLTSTPYPSLTPYPTGTPYPTQTPLPTFTPYPTFTLVPTTVPTATPTATATAMATAKATSTATPEPTATATSTSAARAAGESTLTPAFDGLPVTGQPLRTAMSLAIVAALGTLLVGAGVWEARRRR